MNNHMNSIHTNKSQDIILECDLCDFECEIDFEMRTHMFNEHALNANDLIIQQNNTINPKNKNQFEYLQYVSNIQGRCQNNIKYSKDNITQYS